MKKNKKPTKKTPRSRAPESPAPAVAVKRVQICSGNNRPASDSPPEIQPPTNPLAAKQRIAAVALSFLPIEQLEISLAEGRSVIQPFTIKDMLAKLNGDDVVAVTVWARETADWINTTDPTKAAEGLCQFTFELVQKLNQLGGSTELRRARKTIPAWPTNVTCAGVGTEANIVTRPESRAGTRQKKGDQSDGDWRRWVEAACEAARYNNRYALAFWTLQMASTLEKTENRAPSRMRKTMQVQSYRTPGGRELIWPWWMEYCTDIPEELRAESLGNYERVVEGLVLWHLVVQGGMKEGAEMLGEGDQLQYGGKAGSHADRSKTPDYDPLLALRITERVRKALHALAA